MVVSQRPIVSLENMRDLIYEKILELFKPENSDRKEEVALMILLLVRSGLDYLGVCAHITDLMHQKSPKKIKIQHLRSKEK